ncbi:hypothetical protein VH569_05375 [Azospirillum sp. 11R-A]|uniref:hypothetical protein n=1 Tax=Azospirillum sp. 11R-A TaxID=3111634 RepID=UPI003C23AFDD
MNHPADTERTPEKRCYTRRGALFADHVLALGAEGFSKWLTDSFGGEPPAPRAGWFHYDDDALFSDAFAEVAPEFGQDVLAIAGDGVRRAIKEFDHQQGTYIGLYILTALAETLEITEALPDLAKNFEAWLPSSNDASRKPETVGQIVAFRETLECCFRLLLNSVNGARRSRPTVSWANLADFKALCSWSHDVLLNHSDSRDLTPAHAPLYFLALTSAALSNDSGAITTFGIRLKNGDCTKRTPFDILYTFESPTDLKARYPYNLDEILRLKDPFLQSLKGDILQSERRKLIRKDMPGHYFTASATQGNIPSATEATQYLKALQDWDKCGFDQLAA